MNKNSFSIMALACAMFFAFTDVNSAVWGKKVQDKVIILDGGMGSEIKRRNLPFNEREWSAKILMSGNIDDVKDIHLDYIKSGADVITTNSYGVCLMLGEDKVLQQGRYLVEKSILAATQARREAGMDGILIAGSVSPMFGSYRPDLFSKEKAEILYQQTIEPLIESKEIDLLLIETASSIQEAEFLSEYISKSLDRHNIKKPYWISFTLHDELIYSSPKLRSKEDIEDIAKLIDFIQKNKYQMPSAILFNCSQPEMITVALKKLQEQVLLPLKLKIPTGAYANRFVKEMNIQSDVASDLRSLSPLDYLVFTKKWHKNGATIIGGCCGVGPEYIKMISDYYSAPSTLKRTKLAA